MRIKIDWSRENSGLKRETINENYQVLGMCVKLDINHEINTCTYKNTDCA